MALSYVKELKLAAPSPAQRAALRSAAKAGSALGFVDAGSMVSFSNEISDLHKSDVLHSTLLAQLSADKQFDRRTETQEWYQFYIEVLGNLGWNIHSFHFKEYTTSGQFLNISNVIPEILGEVVTPDELAVVKRTIDSLNTPCNEPLYVVFDEKSCGPSENGNFQSAFCKDNSFGNVVMTMGGFYFCATYVQERWLYFDFATKKIHLFRGTQQAVLNEHVYEQVRQDVIDKLGDNAKTFILDLDI